MKPLFTTRGNSKVRFMTLYLPHHRQRTIVVPAKIYRNLLHINNVREILGQLKPPLFF